MPFTFSHPVLVLPLKYLPKKARSVTGLIIGSVVPDFEKFIKMEWKQTISHTFAGMFWLDLPLAIILTFMFHIWVRDAFIENLPLFFEKRFRKYSGYNWRSYFNKHYALVILSIMIGIVSHIAWDSLSHKGGRMVRTMPFLLNRVPLIFIKKTVPVFQLIQYGGSLAGIFLMLLFIYKMPPEDNLMGNERKQASSGILKYWFISGVLTILIIFLRLIIDSEVRKMDLVFTIISAWLLSIIITPLILKKTQNYLG